MMQVGTIIRRPGFTMQEGLRRCSRRGLLGSGSTIASAIALASLFAAPAWAQPALANMPLNSRPDIVQPAPQQNIAMIPQSVMPRAPVSATISPQEISASQSIPTPIASRHYIETKPISLDAPTIPNVPEPPAVSGAPALAPSNGGALSASFDSVRAAANSAETGASRDGINARATASYNNGNVNFRPDAGGDVVELLTSSAIINWDTFLTGSGGNAVTFLGTGDRLNFTSALSDYTVLNRVFTGALDSAIRIDGLVTSTVNGGSATGGNVWFYSPGGIIIGSTGAFNVGGLMLTSSQLDSFGASGSQMNFSGVANPASAVTIERGASITADNYVAIVAPLIEQHGTVNSAGSVAYVGAEQAQLTINNGLFDISVNVGTSNANGIIHSGTTTGPASAGGNLREISMVAVPKNSAMTMLVGGDIGYQAAGGAMVDANGKITLTAGEGGSVDVNDAAFAGNVSIKAGDKVRIGTSAAGLTSASGNLDITAGIAGVSGGFIEVSSAGTVEIAGDLTLDVSATGDRNTTLKRGSVDISAAGDGASIRVGGDLKIDASTYGIVTEAGAAAVTLSSSTTGAPGGIHIGGHIAIDTSAAAGSNFITTEAGGASFKAESGAISFSSLVFDGRASATGAELGQTGEGRNYKGGTFSLSVGEAGAITGGSVAIKNSAAGVDGKGGNGYGGLVDLALAGGDLSLGDVTIVSTGIGGDAPDSNGLAEFGSDPAGGFGIQRTAAATNFPSAGDGGDGIGGDMVMNLDGGSSTITSLDVVTDGIGSDGTDGDSVAGTDGGNGGNGVGGTASFNGLSGTLIVTEGITVSASAAGGNGGVGAGSDGGNGGEAFGGSAIFTMDGSATVSASSVLVSASATGGSGGTSTIGPLSDPAHNAGNGGDATGGTAVFSDTAGSLTVSFVDVYADAFGGDGGFAQSGGGSASLGGLGGTATAGSATINLNQDDGSDRDYYTSAYAVGGNGGGGDIAGNGGNAAGGIAAINVNDAQIVAGAVVIDASAVGGSGGSSNLEGNPGGNGGNALGGTASLIADGANADYSTSAETFMSAEAFGGDGGGGGSFGTIGGDGGLGGDATGGIVVVTSRNNASLSLLLDSGATASASGGDGGSGGGGTVLNGTGGLAGAAQGGAIAISAVTDGVLDIDGPFGFANVDASANGGRGGGFPEFGQGIPGVNGESTGGSVNITVDGAGSAVSVNGTLNVSSNANGTSDFRSNSTSQGALGGSIDVNVLNGANLSVTGDLNLFSSATATGGENGAAVGQGGSVSFAVGDASGASFGALRINVDGNGVDGISGFGTAGSSGGGGLGGTVDISIGSGATLLATALIATANGTGASGGEGDSGFSGGDGGFGIGGDVSFATGSDVQIFDSFVLEATGSGGDGGGAGTGIATGASGGDAGLGEGGSVRFEASGTGALLPSFGGVSLGASGVGGNGGSGGDGDAATQGGTGGLGGAGIGGSTAFATSGGNATITLNDFLVNFNALGFGGLGGAGGNNFLGGTGGTGGSGGDATGGELAIEAGSGSTITLQPVSTGPYFLSSNAFAGNGGFGGSLDLTNGGVQGVGGDGGAATGGAPTLRALGGTITSGDVAIFATGFGGNGGSGGDDGNATFGPSGNGGDGNGGTPILETFDGSPGIITLGNVSIDASGLAGGGTVTGNTAGGQIVIADGSADIAGLISMTSLTATVVGTAGIPSLIISSDSGPISVTNNVDATVSGDIIFDFDGNGQLVVGGDTLLTSGGEIVGTHTNNPGAIRSIESGNDFIANAATNIGFGTGFAVAAGRDADLDAALVIDIQDVEATRNMTLDAGGDISVGNLTLTGPDVLAAQSIQINAGGDIVAGDVDAIDGLIITGQSLAADLLDGATISVIVGGAINISAAGSPIAGGVVSGGNTTLSGTSITLNSGNIGGNLALDAMGGDIVLLLDGDDQILVGGGTNLTASGDITVIHNGNSNNVISLDSTGNVVSLSQGNFDAQAGSIISGNEVLILAGGNASADDLRAVPALVITAGGDINLNNAVATGPQGVSNLRGITLDAGLNPFISPVYDNLGDVEISGVVDSYADIAIRSGGNTIFNDGSATVANDRIFVQTGDDIVVGIGASVTSARSPSPAPNLSDPFNGVGAVELRAGGLTNLLSIPLTPIASILNYGTIDANGGAIIALANAIDGLNGTFTASSIALDINDAPAVGGAQGDDAGLLSVNCVAGNICIGNIQADNFIEIGQASNNGAIRLFIEQGTVNANSILITIRDNIVMGSDGIATALNAASLFSATSTSGDIDLRDADISSQSVVINAAGSLLGSANISSDTDVGISVGGDIVANSINAGRELTSAGAVGGGAEEFFSTPGNIIVGTITVGAGDVNYTAAGDIDIGTLDVPGSNVSLEAGGLVALGLLGSAAEVFLTGTNASLGTISADSITITAATDVIVNSAVDAANLLTIVAGSLVDLRATTSGADIEVFAADIAIGSAGALGRSDRTNSILIASQNDILLGGAGGASSGFELDNDEFSRVFSGGNITISAESLSTGGGNITVDDLDASAFGISGSPSATAGNLGASGALILEADGNVDVIGNLSIANATADNVLAVFASDQITIDVDNGNLRIESNANTLAGTIDLSANSILAISSAAAADIAGASIEDIDARLGQNDGDVRDEGYIQASNLIFNVNENLLIQNSGESSNFADRRGFLGDSVTINGVDATAPIGIVINGITGDNIGVDSIDVTIINPAFDQASTINGCLIANPSSCVAVPPSFIGSIENPLKELLEEEVEKEGEVGQFTTSEIMQLRDDPEREQDPLINEPVTGAGNEDLWVSEEECEADNETCAADAEGELEPAK